jgi:hypothetical protein
MCGVDFRMSGSLIALFTIGLASFNGRHVQEMRIKNQDIYNIVAMQERKRKRRRRETR